MQKCAKNVKAQNIFKKTHNNVLSNQSTFKTMDITKKDDVPAT